MPCIDQRPNVCELISIGFDDKPDRAHIMRLRLFKRGTWADDRNQDTSWLDHLPGPFQRVTAHQVKDEINVLDDLLKALRRIVNDLRGSQLMQELVMPCRGGGHDVCSSPACELDGKDPNSPCRPMDQDGLSR